MEPEPEHDHDEGGKKRREREDTPDEPAPAEPGDAEAADGESRDDPMDLAIRLAKRSARAGGGPFGAVVVRRGEIVASAANGVVAGADPTAHAEILALREACRVLGTHDLSDCEIFASCEPCPMCLGAIYWSRVRRVWYACDRDDAAAAGFDDAAIYEELAKKPSKRRIPMQRVLRKKGLKAFQVWLANPDRQSY